MRLFQYGGDHNMSEHVIFIQNLIFFFFFFIIYTYKLLQAFPQKHL